MSEIVFKVVLYAFLVFGILATLGSFGSRGGGGGSDRGGFDGM